jgi:hypothetical protein
MDKAVTNTVFGYADATPTDTLATIADRPNGGAPRRSMRDLCQRRHLSILSPAHAPMAAPVFVATEVP